MDTQRANFRVIPLTAVNLSPIITGTAYTYNNTTGVVSSITFAASWDHDDVKVGDTFIDITGGGKATITAVNTTDDEFTIAAGLSAQFDGDSFQIHQNPNSNTALIAANDRKLYSLNSTLDYVPDELIWRVSFIGGTSPTATVQWYGWCTTLRKWVVIDSSVVASSGAYTVALGLEASGELDTTVTTNHPYVWPYVSALGGTPVKVYLCHRPKYASASNKS